MQTVILVTVRFRISLKVTIVHSSGFPRHKKSGRVGPLRKLKSWFYLLAPMAFRRALKRDL